MISKINIFAEVFWFLIPPGVATLIPPVTAKLFPSWNYPLDFHITFRSERIFGDHKTFRGLISGVAAATVAFVIQAKLMEQYPLLAQLDPHHIYKQEWWFGSLFGFTAIISDSIKSFFKRRVNLEPGEPWFPFDQLDWILGSCLVLKLLVPVKIAFIMIAILEGFTLSVFMKYVGYVAGINNSKI